MRDGKVQNPCADLAEDHGPSSTKTLRQAPEMTEEDRVDKPEGQGGTGHYLHVGVESCL